MNISSKEQRQIITTAALPYANGSIHIGHLVEYLQTDFWVRFQKMRGHKCLYICADDTHGTPIMVRARHENITPENLIAKSFQEHLKDFTDFHIKFDKYSSTHTDTNRDLVENIYKKLKTENHISTQWIDQAYCEHDKMFLPDRFVVGTCPQCQAPNQYGDSCESCSATYSPLNMSDAKCSICSNTPTSKRSEHVFFQLHHFQDFLKDWVPKHTAPEISNKLQEWLQAPLRDWDISRDTPYFGFPIPGYSDKYFYVWVDAPVGYLATTKLWCEDNGIDFLKFWNDTKTEIYHFIGKDIVYFHSLFWPAMLKATGYQQPCRVFVHGFLTVNGEKMSKSKGTFIQARTYLDHLNPTHLRYYYACKLRGIDDLDLNLEDFVSRVNSDLIGKITNLGSRGAQMLQKKMDGIMSQELSPQGLCLVKKAQDQAELIAQCMEERNFSKAIVEIRTIADEANRYFDELAPWTSIKENPEETRKILTDILNIFRILAIYLKPIIPHYTKQVESLFQSEPFQWNSLNDIITGQRLSPYHHIANRVDPKAVEAMLKASKGP